ncbi:hypothetical protein GQ53DRAFT_458442 [Thozetella sp. PMI_491]|nr:hypothetical protein GQ53DRAFT_458442 [Thozetella sp. PMI_491]
MASTYALYERQRRHTLVTRQTFSQEKNPRPSSTSPLSSLNDTSTCTFYHYSLVSSYPPCSLQGVSPLCYSPLSRDSPVCSLRSSRLGSRGLGGIERTATKDTSPFTTSFLLYLQLCNSSFGQDVCEGDLAASGVVISHAPCREANLQMSGGHASSLYW